MINNYTASAKLNNVKPSPKNALNFSAIKHPSAIEASFYLT